MNLNYAAFKTKFGPILASVFAAALTRPDTHPRVNTMEGSHGYRMSTLYRTRQNHGRHLRKYRPTRAVRRARREMQVASRRANRA